MPEEHQLVTRAPAESIPAMADQIAQLHSSLRNSCFREAAVYETTQDWREDMLEATINHGGELGPGRILTLTVREQCLPCKEPNRGNRGSVCLVLSWQAVFAGTMMVLQLDCKLYLHHLNHLPVPVPEARQVACIDTPSLTAAKSRATSPAQNGRQMTQQSH